MGPADGRLDDGNRWDLYRLASQPDEDRALAEEGLAEWAAALAAEEDDGTP